MGGILTRRRALLRDETAVIPPTPSGDPWYGVDWFYSGTSPQLTRIGSAANFSDPQPATSLNGSGSSPFDSIMPWAGMKRYNIINGAVSYSQDDAGFSQTSYDTVVYIPEFYYRAEKDTTEQRWTWAISPTAQEGFTKHPGSGRYVGRYHTSGGSSGVFSKSGVAPLVRTGLSDFRTYSNAKDTNWWLLDLASWAAVQMLYLVEYAHFGSQTMLGTGYSGVTSGVAAGGATDSATYHTLKISGGHNQYRWIEDPFSNGFVLIDGLAATRTATYAAVSDTGYSSGTTGKISLGFGLPISNAILGFGYSTELPWAFIPNAASGSVNNEMYVTDYLSSSSGSYKAARVGGGANVDAGYGLFCIYCDATETDIFGNSGARLMYIP